MFHALVVTVCVLSGTNYAAVPVPRKAPEKTGTYQVVPVGDSAILVNTQTGETWMLNRDRTATQPSWVPIQRMTAARDALLVKYNAEKARVEQEIANIREIAPAESTILQKKLVELQAIERQIRKREAELDRPNKR